MPVYKGMALFCVAIVYYCNLNSICRLINTSIVCLTDRGWFDQRQHGTSEGSGSCWEG